MPMIMCLPDHNGKGSNKNNQVKGPLWEQRKMFGARIKITWEKQLVDPPIHYITSVIAL